MSEPAPLRIDFVSDVVCPWCMIGLASLETAIARLDAEVRVELHVQPFELNPDMPLQGEDATQHLMAEYGIDAAAAEANRAAVRERAAAVGVPYTIDHRSRIWNTLDAHRLLHWAAQQGADKAVALKRALYRAYFGAGANVSDHAVLARVAGTVGLDAAAARQILDSGACADATRERERYYQSAGINSVPATIVNERTLIPGGQTPEVFEGALRDIAATAAS